MSGVIRISDGAATFRGEFACPHCGHVNSRYFSWWSHAPEVVCCDCEEGGCDTYFTVTAQVDITVTPTVRKIEGIEPVERAAADLDWTHDEGGAS